MSPARRQPTGTMLRVEHLEDRLTPATSGVAWPDGAHLTLSFVPDGTPAGAAPSSLFQTLNAAAPAPSWQREILRAFQAWAVNANVNVGVVPDSGDPLGATGVAQGDPRFGDIRVAAVPLPAGTLITNTQFQWSGTTWSGDLLVNSTYAFSVGQGQVSGKYDLFTAMLNEAGNVFGVLDSQTDSTSAVYYQYTTAKTGLNAHDVADIRSLYGARVQDKYDLTKANGTTGAATALANTTAALNFEADVTSASDVDYYKVTLPTGVVSLNAKLTTSGLSALQGSVQVLDSTGKVLGSAAATDPLTGDLSAAVSGVKAGSTYYVRVAGNAPAGSVFATGAYRLSVVYTYADGSTNAPTGGTAAAPVADNHTNDTTTRATDIAPAFGATDARFQATYRGAVEDGTDVDFYRIHSPTTIVGAQKLDVMVWALPGSGLVPKVEVFDVAYRPMAVTVLANEGGTYSVEVLNTVPGSLYYAKVSAQYAAGSHNTGGYFLGGDFSNQAAVPVQSYASGTLAQPGARQEQTLTVGQNRLFEFLLTATSATQWAEVKMDVLDAAGNVVFSLASYAGTPVATGHVYLAAGSYTIRYTAGAPQGPAGAVSYTLTGREISDPIGPGYTGGTTSTTASATADTTAAPVLIWDQPIWM